MPSDRQPLVDQVIVTLLDELAQGLYPQRVPSERDLAIHLKVSRPIVRSALEVLEKQGWVQKQGSSKSRTVIKRPQPKTIHREKRRVGFLTSRPLDKLSVDDFNTVNGIMERCESSGWECVVHPLDQLDHRNLERRLMEIVETPPCDLWLGFPMLNYRCLSSLHRAGYQVIGVGINDRGAGYGVIHYDTVSARIHAVGVLLRAGRRNIMVPTFRRNPELAERMKRLFAKYEINYREDFHYPLFDDTRAGFIRLLELQFAARPQPDGIVVTYTTEVQVILLMGWLSKYRIRYPEDLSIVQIGSDTFLDLVHIPFSHYTSPPGPLVQAGFDCVRRYLTTGELLTGRMVLEMEYIKGESV